MTIDNFETIKQYVLTLGDFEESPKLDLQIEMIINEVLAYCYRKDVKGIHKKSSRQEKHSCT